MSHDGAPVILTLNNCYLPGFKGGGPVRTLEGMVEQLGGEFRFRIACQDRDKEDSAPYAGIRPRSWTPLGQAEVFYLPPGVLLPSGLLQMLSDTPHDLLYLNSLFSWPFGIAPLLHWRRSLRRRSPLLLAPRGQLSEGALSVKPLRKRIFLEVVGPLGLLEGLHFQASSELEAEEIRRWCGDRASIFVASDLAPMSTTNARTTERSAKMPGRLQVVFVSRITHKKNLLGAVRMLAGLGGTVTLDVYGPNEEPAYLAQALELARTSGVRMTYQGPVTPDQVGTTFSRHHVFLFPTLGENFGHVILEALRAGCPVLTSDRTPWSGLASGRGGWAISLDDEQQFRERLRELLESGEEEHGRLRRSARAYAQEFAEHSPHREANRNMLRTILAGRTGQEG